jgi:hypothetical protein
MARRERRPSQPGHTRGHDQPPRSSPEPLHRTRAICSGSMPSLRRGPVHRGRHLFVPALPLAGAASGGIPPAGQTMLGRASVQVRITKVLASFFTAPGWLHWGRAAGAGQFHTYAQCTPAKAACYLLLGPHRFGRNLRRPGCGANVYAED